jgi:thiamine biosynthesis lipoprotein
MICCLHVQRDRTNKSFAASGSAGSFRTVVLLILCLVWVAPSHSSPRDQPPLTRFEFTEPHMGTLFRIVCYAEDVHAAKLAANAAFGRIAELDNIMSDYSPTSELTRLSQQSGGPPQKVSPDLFYVLGKAQETARMTDGAFDVTVGPVVKLWRRARRRRELPDSERLSQALQLVGFAKVRLDEASHSIQLSESGMGLDLGGIAKGYAADEALKVLKQFGLTSSLVAAGGDIAVGNPPPGIEGWTVAISPLDLTAKSPENLLLREAAVSTSGDAEQFVEIEGKRYSHIVDPKTGIGLIGHRLVTVVAPNGITADSLATAVCVMGPSRGLELVDSTKDAAALFVEATADGVQTFRSQRWKEQ